MAGIDSEVNGEGGGKRGSLVGGGAGSGSEEWVVAGRAGG